MHLGPDQRAFSERIHLRRIFVYCIIHAQWQKENPADRTKNVVHLIKALLIAAPAAETVMTALHLEALVGMTTDPIDQGQKEKILDVGPQDHLQKEADEVLKIAQQAVEEVVLTLPEEAAIVGDLMIAQTNLDHFQGEEWAKKGAAREDPAMKTARTAHVAAELKTQGALEDRAILAMENRKAEGTLIAEVEADTALATGDQKVVLLLIEEADMAPTIEGQKAVVLIEGADTAPTIEGQKVAVVLIEGADTAPTIEGQKVAVVLIEEADTALTGEGQKALEVLIEEADTAPTIEGQKALEVLIEEADTALTGEGQKALEVLIEEADTAPTTEDQKVAVLLIEGADTAPTIEGQKVAVLLIEEVDMALTTEDQKVAVLLIEEVDMALTTEDQKVVVLIEEVDMALTTEDQKVAVEEIVVQGQIPAGRKEAEGLMVQIVAIERVLAALKEEVLEVVVEQKTAEDEIQDRKIVVFEKEMTLQNQEEELDLTSAHKVTIAAKNQTILKKVDSELETAKILEKVENQDLQKEAQRDIKETQTAVIVRHADDLLMRDLMMTLNNANR